MTVTVLDPNPSAPALDTSARFPALVDLAVDAPVALAGMHVVLVGLGSIGLHVLDAVARLGVRAITAIDPGRIKAESLLTHPVAPADLGRNKAAYAGARVRAIDPRVAVTVVDGAVQDAPLALFLEADAIVLASDNLACEAFVSERATALGVPLIQASVHGPTLTAQVRSIAGATGNGAEDTPCLLCAWTAREWEDLDRGTRFSCEGAGETRAPEGGLVPTRSLPQLCGIAGQMASLELLRRALGIVDAAASHQIELNGYRMNTVRTPLPRNARCEAPHARWGRAALSQSLAAQSPGALVALAAAAAASDSNEPASDSIEPASDAGDLALELPGFVFVEAIDCACGPATPIGRFALDAEPIAVRCPRCGEARRPHALHRHRVVPRELCDLHGATPIAALGAPDAAIALVHTGRRVVLCHATREAAQ